MLNMRSLLAAMLVVSGAAGAQVGPIPYSKLGQPNGPAKLDAAGKMALGLGANATYNAIYPTVSFSDLLSSAITVTTNPLVQKTAIAGYVRNQAAASGSNGNAVGLFSAGTAEVNGAATWGINTLLQDAADRTVGSGIGRVLVNEFDFNVMNAGTQVIGLSLGGNSLVQPTTANAFVVNPLGAGIKWTGGLLTTDGAAVYAISIGTSVAVDATQHGVPNSPGQLVALTYLDSTGLKQSVTLQAVSAGGGSAGFLSMTSSGGVDLSLGGRTLYAGGVNAGSSSFTSTIYATGLPTCASAPPSGGVCRDTTTTPYTLRVIP